MINKIDICANLKMFIRYTTYQTNKKDLSMSIIKNAIQDLVILQNGKIGKSLLTIKPIKQGELFDIRNIRYAPQNLHSDIVQISANKTPNLINESTLQELVNKNLTLQEISDTLNVSMSTIRFYLKKYNITRFSEEITALKKYFKTKDPKEKAEAFKIIDKSLKKIAQKEAQTQTDIPFEDCLQNVRLRFLELMGKKDKDKSISVYKILEKVENSAPTPQPKIEKIGLKEIANEIGITDSRTARFETIDRANFLIKNSNLSNKAQEIIEHYLIKETPIDEISDTYGLTRQRILQILENGLAKVKKYNYTKNNHFSETLKSHILQDATNI